MIEKFSSLAMTLEVISYITLFFILIGMTATLGYVAYRVRREDQAKLGKN